MKLSNYLGTLEAEPDDVAAIEGIRAIVASGDVERLGEEPFRLIEMARQGHELRGELPTVARLIEVALPLIQDDTLLTGSLCKELGRLRTEYLLDPEGARAAYEKALEARPGDSEILDALKRLEQAEQSWKKFAKRFVEEADSATDLSLQTSLLLRAASLTWEWKRKGKGKDADKLFKRVLEIEPGNVKAALLFENVLREREEWSALGPHLLEAAEHARDRQDRINFYVRAARVFARKLGEKSRAAACYERVLDFDPTNGEAMAYLSEHFTDGEQWDHLAGLYEDALRVPQKLDVEQGMLLQIGMVHYRMRKRPEDAEPFFARLRKLDPAHPAMLDFYRDHLKAKGEVDELLRILGDAQRVCADPARRVELACETARTAQATPGMTERAIDAWKVVQRLDPAHEEAARVLKELYAKAEKWNALVDVLKAQIDATPDSEVERKVALLRELGRVYHERLRLDGMLINVYNAILRLQPDDRATLTALADKYRELGRWNDLINVLTQDAEASTDVASKITTYLMVADLWVEHFSNHNQAASPLEKVLDLEPHNRKALSRLRDIYEKKRAWKQLFEVLRKEIGVASDPSARAGLTVAMAELAADRLHRYSDAIALWREVASDETYGKAALEAMEKLAEREKDWATLAEVLDRQVAREPSSDGKIRVLLKLGSLCSERMEDPAGASRAYQRVLEIDPKQGRALRALRDSLLAAGQWDELQKLYERAGDFEALVDVLSGEADRVQAPETKIDLSFRVARIFEEKLGEPARAQRSYERVLSVEPTNERAARALAPLYEREEKWSRLATMLELLLRATPETDKGTQLSLLGRLRVLAQEKLRDGEGCLAYAQRAYELAPESDDVRAAFEAAAELAQAFERLVQAFRARTEVADAKEALLLHRRIAVLSGERLARTELAVEHWKHVLLVAPDDAEASAALERLYRAEGKMTEVRDVLVRRLQHTSDERAQRELLRELAAIEEEKLSDPDAAATRYRALSELDPTSVEVWAALDRLATAAERHEELAGVLRRRLELEQERAQRVELGARLGVLLIAEKAAKEALPVLSDVLELEPGHGPTLAALEELAGDNNKLAPKINVQLEKAYERTGRFDKVAKVIALRLKQVKDEAELRRLRLRLAEISGGKLGDALGAYVSIEAAFLEEPSDRALWDKLAAAAEVAKQHRALASAYARAIDAEGLSDGDRVELATRAAQIYDEVIGEKQEAEAFHKRVLQHEPLADRAFAALKDLYTNQERWEDLQALYRKRIDETLDGEQRLDLLLQVCFLFEEILDRPDNAIEAYQAVLELSPDHGPSRRTLEKLYERTERHRDLANLLRTNLDQAEGYDQVDILYRLGELYETKLSEPALAVEHYEGVLQNQPHHLRAQAALARLLSVQSQRQRVAAILEPIYESQGAYTDLVRVLEIQLADREGDSSKAALFMRIGELYETRVKDADAAFSAYAGAVEAEPSDNVAREALARVASTRDAFRRKRAQVLERVVGATEDVDLQIDLLLELGELLDKYLDDKVAAERAYERLVELGQGRDDVVMTAAKALERFHTQSGDHVRLAKDLERQVELELDAAARERLYVRLAELYEQKLEDAQAAIGARKRSLEQDADNRDALMALERLYEGAGQFTDLIEILERRVQLAQDDDTRRALTRRIAHIYEEKLSDAERATSTYRDVLSTFGHDRETLAALIRLYEHNGAHDDLIEMLEADAALAASHGERAMLRFRAGEVLREKLGDVERALSCYEVALEEDPEHVGTLGALDALMKDAESPHRLDAARLAAPRYEALRSYDKLLGVLELQASVSEDEIDQLAALRHAATVAERGQRDAVQAMAYVGRALRIAATHESLPELLAEYARLADVTGRYADYVAGLQEIAPNIFDIEQKLAVYRRVAEVAREKMSDTALARASLRLLLQEQADDMPALDALIALDEEAGDHAALIDVLKRKTDLVSDASARAALLMRQADVYERGQGDTDNAISTLEDLMAQAPSMAVFASLERLYLRVHRWSELGSMYATQLDHRIGDPVELHYKLARNCRQHLSDTHAALDHLRDAVTRDPKHADSIALLESILSEHGEYRAVAAEILEPGYLARMEWAKLTGALRARVEAELDLDERKKLLLRLARIYEEQLEDFDETFEVYARIFREDPRDEELWETLTRLAKVGGHYSRLAKVLGEVFVDVPVEDPVMAKLARYVASIYDERAVNLVKAAELYEKCLEFDRDDRECFRALESVYKRASNHAALLELYAKQAEAATDDKERVDLLHRRARVYSVDLEDRTKAGEVYREIVEIDPGDAEAVAGLEATLLAAQDFAEFAEHLRRRVEHAAGTPDELVQKYRLAEVLWDKLHEEQAAVDVLDEITQADPKNGPAMTMLERIVQNEAHTLRVTEILEPMYRHLDQWKKRIAISEARLALLTEPSDKARLLAEVAELHEQRGKDLGHAFRAYARAMVIEPDNDAVRGEIDRIASRVGAWDEHVAAYEAALAAASDDGVKAQLLTTIARVHDEKRGDPRAAIQAYDRLLALEPDDPSTLDSLEALHTMVGDWRGLIAVFERKVTSAFDAQERAELLRRIGSVLDELLGDRDAAVAAYRRALTEVDTDELALEALDRLYTAGGHPQDLAEILARRVELASEAEPRVEHGLRLAFVYEESLHRIDEAIEAYRRVLDDEPGSMQALTRLQALYERQGAWPELLDNLRTQIELLQDPAERVRLRCKAGALLATEMGDVSEAVELYREALVEEPGNDIAIRALLAFAQRAEHHALAAEVLEPLLREQGRWDDLVQLLERRAELTEDAIERRAELVRLAEVHEQGRRSQSDAFAVLTRALACDAADQTVQADLERLAAALGTWRAVLKAFSECAAALSEPEEASALFRRAGRVAEQELQDDASAIEAFLRASERDDDAPETLLALDRLYTKTGRWEPLVDVLERRISALTAPAERAELLVRLGEVRDARFNDGRGAFVAYQEVLDNDPGDTRALEGMQRLGQRDELALDVLQVLERCYRETGAVDKVVNLYDIKVRLAPGDSEKVQLLREAAGIWENELREPGRALLSLRRAFEIDSSDMGLLDELERLADTAQAWPSLSGLAEQLVAAGAIEGARKREVLLRASGWYRERMHDADGELRCLEGVLSVDPDALQVHARVVELLRAKGDAVALLRGLRAWAEVEADAQARKERLYEAAELAQRVGDATGAVECLQGVMEASGDEAPALSMLADIKTAQGQFAEVVALLGRLLHVEPSVEGRVGLRYRVADLQAGRLGDEAAAVETYKALLQEDPSEVQAETQLALLLERLGRFAELRELLSRQLVRVDELGERVALHTRLAELLEHKLQQSELAIDEWRALLTEVPTHGRAWQELERLYAAASRHEDLAKLLGARISQALDAGDAELATEKSWQLVALYADALRDPERALSVLERLQSMAPRDPRVVSEVLRLQQATSRFAEAAVSLQTLMSLRTGEEAVETALALADLATVQLQDAVLAEHALRSALALDPSRAATRERLRGHLESSQQFQKLAELLAEDVSLATKPDDQKALLVRIAALYSDKLGDPAEASRQLERAVQLAPDDRAVLLSLCDLYVAAQRYKDAVPVLEKIIASYAGRRAKEVATYEHRLGQAYESGGDFEEALKHYDAAFKIDLTSVPVLRDLGRLCLERGDLDRAQKTYRALLLQKLAPEHAITKADVYFRLGEISAKQGDKPKAKSMLERAITEGGQHPQAKQLLEQL